jgi:hypothetical protein
VEHCDCQHGNQDWESELFDHLHGWLSFCESRREPGVWIGKLKIVFLLGWLLPIQTINTRNNS